MTDVAILTRGKREILTHQIIQPMLTYQRFGLIAIANQSIVLASSQLLERLGEILYNDDFGTSSCQRVDHGLTV